MLLLASLLCPDMPAGHTADTPMLLALDAPAAVVIKTLDVLFDGAKATLDYRLVNPTKSSALLKFHVEVSAERCEGECCEPLPASAPNLRVDGGRREDAHVDRHAWPDAGMDVTASN